MGKLEEENKKNIRATKIQKVVLRTIATAGLLSVALLAPNALQMLKLFGLDKKLKSMANQTRSINNSRQRLVKNGLVAYSDSGFLYLTKAGEKILREIENRDFKIKKPKKWDRKWRILIFDIKERNRDIRNKIRNTLVSIGFIKLQQSVWVYPYDCEDLITLLKADFEVGKEILYIIADRIENEKVLLNYFGLKS
jgi:CRISPR-associated endonuclease Cas2